jgi:hypothetical protein
MALHDGTPGGNVASAAAALQTHLEGDAPDAARNQRWGVATAVWALLCTRVLMSVVPELPVDRYPLLFLYYQPLFLVVRAPFSPPFSPLCSLPPPPSPTSTGRAIFGSWVDSADQRGRGCWWRTDGMRG